MTFLGRVVHTAERRGVTLAWLVAIVALLSSSGLPSLDRGEEEPTGAGSEVEGIRAPWSVLFPSIRPPVLPGAAGEPFLSQADAVEPTAPAPASGPPAPSGAPFPDAPPVAAPTPPSGGGGGVASDAPPPADGPLPALPEPRLPVPSPPPVPTLPTEPVARPAADAPVLDVDGGVVRVAVDDEPASVGVELGPAPEALQGTLEPVTAGLPVCLATACVSAGNTL